MKQMVQKVNSKLKMNSILEGFHYTSEIEHITEIIDNKLYFAVLEANTKNKALKNNTETFYFTIDDELLYMNYYFDFGPLNISCLYKYCCKVNSYLQVVHGVKRIVHYTSSDPCKRVNSAYLMGSYAIIFLKMEPREIYRILLSAGGTFRNFVDASQGISQYTIRLSDCLLAIGKAISLNFFDFHDFNIAEYDIHDKIQNGDFNWLVPRKFVAFMGPSDLEAINTHPPNFYIKYFTKNNVKTVIRLNNKVYNASVFAQAGMDHYELFFPDGTTPPKTILLRFLDISENSSGAIAVHCKAGLGRTGSLIGAYLIKHYRMTAREAIAWMRICRPGSVIGQQQDWLEKIQNWLWRQGSQYRLHNFGDGDKIPRHRFGIYSREWPKEREKLIKEAQRQKVENLVNKCSKERPKTQTTFSVSPYERIPNIFAHQKMSMRHHEYGKKIFSSAKDADFKKISELIARATAGPLTSRKVNTDRVIHNTLQNGSNNTNFENTENIGSGKTHETKMRKHLNTIANMECARAARNNMEHEETQGDKLNRIKIKKHLDSFSNADRYERKRKNYLVCEEPQGDRNNNMKGKKWTHEGTQCDQVKYRKKINSITQTNETEHDKLPSSHEKHHFNSCIDIDNVQDDKMNDAKTKHHLKNAVNMESYGEARTSNSTKLEFSH